jgi:AcrR family transcriptional regulator
MKTAVLPSAYESPLREEQREATRKRILDAAGALMEDRGLQQFSYAALAEQAGVTERTVYRHFPSKDTLFQGLWEWYAERTRFGAIAQSEKDLLAQPLRTFPAFEENEQLCRALWLSPQGRDFRLGNVEDRKAGIKAAIAEATRGLPPREAKWIAAIAHLLVSGNALWTMKDYWGLSGEEAGKASAMALGMLLNAARERVLQSSKAQKA